MSDSFSLSCELQSFVRAQQKRISNACNPGDIQESLNLLLGVLEDGVLPMLDLTCSQRNHLKIEFTKKYFIRCSDLLLFEPSVGFLSSLDGLEREKLEKYFCKGPSSESLIVLVGALSQTSKANIANLIASLLEKIIVSKGLKDIFVKNCLKSEDSSVRRSFNENQIITFIVSLPERVANSLKVHSKSVFYPEAYFTETAQQIEESIEAIHSAVASETDKVSLVFLSNVIGRICMTGHGKTLFANLVPCFEDWLVVSPLWSSICHKLVVDVPDHELEPVLENLLKEAHSPQIVSKLLCKDVIKNTRVKFLLTTKFLLLRYYSDLKIMRNIVGYLSSVKDEKLIIETLWKLLDSWSNRSAIQHTPYNQHAYISYSIVHIVGYIGSTERQKYRHEALKKLLSGVQNHLESADHSIRRLGMILAESLTSAFEPNTEKLHFEYNEDHESLLIKELLKGPESKLEVSSCVTEPLFESSRAEDKVHKPVEDEGADVQIQDMSESDDDLQPYDLEEEDFEGGRPLHHLRECMEALLESKDVEKFESALKSLEKVVFTAPTDLDEVCVELLKILLHLQDQYSTDDFATLRFKSMVAISARCPIKSADYLTEEFYGVNYTIIQRLDILDVIVATAKELSQPVEMIKEKATSKKFITLNEYAQDKKEEIPEWKKIVEERIEKKTRRFAKGPSKEQPKPVANKFSDVAGNFFYPLMKNFDQKQNTLDLLGEDHYVLGRLIYTLGIIIHNAVGVTGVCNMSNALIEFTWALRYHQEAIVRQMLLFAIVMVFTSVPLAVLLDTCKEGIFEIHNWLKDVMNKDDNIEVKKTAVQALIVLEEAFKKEMAQDV